MRAIFFFLTHSFIYMCCTMNYTVLKLTGSDAKGTWSYMHGTRSGKHGVPCMQASLMYDRQSLSLIWIKFSVLEEVARSAIVSSSPAHLIDTNPSSPAQFPKQIKCILLEIWTIILIAFWLQRLTPNVKVVVPTSKPTFSRTWDSSVNH